MALEQIFSCPRALARLRSAPLGELLEDFGQWQIDNRFSRSTMRSHLSDLSHLNVYLAEREDTFRYVVTVEDIDGFFRAYALRCRHRASLAVHLRHVHWAVGRFVGYLRETGGFEAALHSPPYQPLLDDYCRWMQRQRNAAEGTLRLRCHSLMGFLQRLGPLATVEGLVQLDADQVEQLYLRQAQGMGQAARRSLQAAVRTFLRFCRARGMIRLPLDEAVPTLRTYRLSSVPRAFSEAQAHAILHSIDRRSAVGLRDFAILLLLYTFGVRSGQVRALCLADIHWRDSTIRFQAQKNGKDIELPLTEAVGEALLAYLQEGRPPTTCDQVFLTTRAPYRPLRNSSNIRQIVAQAVARAGLDIAPRGAHAFRHGFATRMLAQGQSLKAIADVLGHRRLSTTFGYTKVDFNQLEAVALNWPQALPPC